MTTLPLGAYRPGRTWLHRLPAGAKLLALLVTAVVVTLVRGPASAVVFVALTVGLVAWSGAPLRRTLRSLRGFALVAVALTAYQVWTRGWAPAVETVGDLLGMILLATVLTTTTAVDDLIDVVTRVLGPLRPLGVDPARVGLAFSLMIRALPTTLEIALQTRDAARARGLQRSPRALLVPMVVRVVAGARATGDALHARGLGDD
ncbi:energy-coupling factor transporter transmembrane protein EcfT [Nocardioides sp. ChNu-153]|uniref:energy-coupling factor transporter transmembrane component T family protein n=1 Tax=unclassified Nocardioides TaxID=2615069 RepID=UPI002405132F|nr:MULTISPECIES: energy-coupling factor transporter transmembrane protein EcfT [unclassified Nocardioides]MDF9714874.1 energy-coupling factor transporter transmembrane protein EcfT [Nocardioides sp. ChNu-99]MDN7120000.1 energy-coupling factor transporter transmembrane protein EcfT [Nocardioides sp. ChNu-153]